MELRELARDCLDCQQDEISSYVRAGVAGAGEPEGYFLIVHNRAHGRFAAWKGHYTTREEAELVAAALFDPVLRLSLATGEGP